MQLINDYMRDEKLRHALNELTGKVFGFDFEDWVIRGYYEGDYIPYSYIEDGKILSNVSANKMRFMQNGTEKNYIQLGTVMTDEAVRGRGLAGKLIRHVVSQYKDRCDGIYLFGNLDALGFYRKMGFLEVAEYRYSVKNEYLCKEKAGSPFVPVDPTDVKTQQKYLRAVRESAVNSSFEQLNKFGLQMFYTGSFEDLYYAQDLDCFIVAEAEGEEMILMSIICATKVSLQEILKRINCKTCRLGFTPLPEDQEICDAKRYDGEDDYRLFYLGDELEKIETDRLYFPEFSHA